MEQSSIGRINELARKARTQGLTPEEESEQAALRQEYLAAIRASLTGQLENTYILDPATGVKRKLRRKDD
jgi:uncharacterized protein YnzC (UPF0291/DUF896 family)